MLLAQEPGEAVSITTLLLCMAQAGAFSAAFFFLFASAPPCPPSQAEAWPIVLFADPPEALPSPPPAACHRSPSSHGVPQPSLCGSVSLLSISV